MRSASRWSKPTPSIKRHPIVSSRAAQPARDDTAFRRSDRPCHPSGIRPPELRQGVVARSNSVACWEEHLAGRPPSRTQIGCNVDGKFATRIGCRPTLATRAKRKCCHPRLAERAEGSHRRSTACAIDKTFSSDHAQSFLGGQATTARSLAVCAARDDSLQNAHNTGGSLARILLSPLAAPLFFGNLRVRSTHLEIRNGNCLAPSLPESIARCKPPVDRRRLP
jgi:hypothetical protein